MKKSVLFLIILVSVAMLLSVAGCSQKKVDPKEDLQQKIDKGMFKEAKQAIISIRSDYPNDQKVIELEKLVDAKIAEMEYQKLWSEAEAKNNYQEWIRVMIKVKAIENSNRDAVNEWIKKASTKTIDTAAKQLKDDELLGLLNLLVVRYQVLAAKDRLMYITMFFREGRFPIAEWKDTFISKYPELMDEKGNFVGYPRPEKEQQELPKAEEKKPEPKK